MKLSELLTEVLDSTYPYKLKKFSDGMSATFKNANSDKVTVTFVGHHVPDAGWSYEIQFGIKDSIELTEKGDEFKTISTVMAVIDEFMTLKDDWQAKMVPVLMWCTSDSTGRNKLYAKLMNRLCTKHKRFKMVTVDQFPEKFKNWWNDYDLEGKQALFAIKTFMKKNNEAI